MRKWKSHHLFNSRRRSVVWNKNDQKFEMKNFHRTVKRHQKQRISTLNFITLVQFEKFIGFRMKLRQLMIKTLIWSMKCVKWHWNALLEIRYVVDVIFQTCALNRKLRHFCLLELRRKNPTSLSNKPIVISMKTKNIPNALKAFSSQ